MTAGVQRASESFEEVSERRAASGGTTDLAGQKEFRTLWPFPWQDGSAPIEIAERPSEYEVVLPLIGIDPRNIYVFATPRALLIEIRFKSTVCHALVNAAVTETIDRRIAREFSLPIEIEQGATAVQIQGQILHITARKSPYSEQGSWSELVHFDIRPA
jgi:HSP20 family molecular chaperone IbpA